MLNATQSDLILIKVMVWSGLVGFLLALFHVNNISRSFLSAVTAEYNMSGSTCLFTVYWNLYFIRTISQKKKKIIRKTQV